MSADGGDGGSNFFLRGTDEARGAFVAGYFAVTPQPCAFGAGEVAVGGLCVGICGAFAIEGEGVVAAGA